MVGVFDSGLGGLTIVEHILRGLPGNDVVYVADQAHIPYGGRPAAEVLGFSRALTRFLLDQGAELIVVACNTATALAIDELRTEFPGLPFVGVEPAVKPAAQATTSGRIGVLATAATLASPRYASLKNRFAPAATFQEDPCQGLVMRIERGERSSEETRRYLTDIVSPWLAEGVDTLVLGCTHYPLVRPLLASIAGEAVAIIDSGPAVARQVARRLSPSSSENGRGRLHLYSTAADPLPLARFAGEVMGLDRLAELISFPWPVDQRDR